MFAKTWKLPRGNQWTNKVLVSGKHELSRQGRTARKLMCMLLSEIS